MKKKYREAIYESCNESDGTHRNEFGGGKKLGRLRRIFWVTYTHGLGNERRISAKLRTMDII